MTLALPSNRLESLRGDREGQFSIRINAQWRVCSAGLRTGHTTWRSWTTTARRTNVDIKNGMRPVHPGEILREEVEAAGVSEGALSKALDVPLSRVTLILEGRQGITADTALRLACYSGTSPQLRLNLQQTWGLRRAEIEVGRQITKRVAARQSAA